MIILHIIWIFLKWIIVSNPSVVWLVLTKPTHSLKSVT